MASENHASAPIDLTLAQNYFAKTRNTRVFPGWWPSLSDRSPSKAYPVRFSAKVDHSFRSSTNLKNHPHRLNIKAKIISRELGKLEFSRGGDLAYRIDHPRKPILWSFRRNLTTRLGAWQVAVISDTIAVSMPYFDSSGWFLIEKTTILTNSCCLYVQPTFGYLRGSAFRVALRTEGWLVLYTAPVVR